MKILQTGVPQGSILGPLLFSIYINDITNATEILESILYADDTTLIFNPNNNLDDIAINNLINLELKNISDWFRTNKLSLNIEKTKFMIFHRPRTTPPTLNLTIDETQLEQVNTFKFLGLLLNQNMTWTDHIKLVRSKISKTIGVINKIKYTVPKPILLTLYRALILPHLNFQILNWGRDTAIENIVKLQKRAIRAISRVRYFAHTKPLFKSLKLLKFEDLYQAALLKFNYKYENKLLPAFFLNLDLKRNCDYHDYNTRHCEQIAIIAHKTNYFEELIRYQLIKFRNSLPRQIHEDTIRLNIQTVAGIFKRNIISSYDDVCIVDDCYTCNLAIS